tara:strand:- start:513 stop:794 length:282 start_codon:yes stop_codon:yes gene_type:complete
MKTTETKATKKEACKTTFFTIFKDSNSWNEKSIVGFLSFAVIVLFAITDLITGIWSHELIVSNTIYNSLMIITLGSFGIDGIQQFARKRTDVK